MIVVAVTRGEDAPAPSSTPAQADQPGSAQPASPPAPGAVETDLSGRQVIIPTNQSGDILSTSTDDGGTCEDIRSPRGLQIQRINQYPILFSTDTGPTRIQGSVPTGYADGPRGAVLAGANYLWLMQSGGTPGKDTVRNHMVVDDVFRETMEAELADGFNTERNNLGAPMAFKVRSCSDRAVVIDYAYDLFGDATGAFPEPKWIVQSILMVRDSNEWKLRFAEGTHTSRGVTENREGFTTWDM
ncbi:hypothetical protein [Dietzia sp. Alg238-R159]|uniref:hypothetical protein n=1 Tax=Dietzia sp. Alg238-R159 TaxID=2305986 RepID=UPI0013D099EF|nr:hypothetical protein [Dietzia sp. Alg238-R159]